MAAANKNGVNPSNPLASTFAPFSIRSLTTSVFPSQAAKCNAVYPSERASYTQLEFSSMSFINQLMEGKMSALPNVQYVMSDVRDVAEIHVKSLSKPESNGRRLIVTTRESYSFINVAEILHLNGFIKKMPSKAPSLLLKTIGLFNNEVKGMLPFVDSKVTADTSLTEKIFNWKSRSLQEMIMDTAESIKVTKQL